jgi:hypothetical protein
LNPDKPHLYKLSEYVNILAYNIYEPKEAKMIKSLCAVFLCLLVIQPVIAQDATATPRPRPPRLWQDATPTTIGVTADWTNKVELADINNDGRVDILFANGGLYDAPGTPVMSRVFINTGSDPLFEDATESVFGTTTMLARVIKVRDVNADMLPDIFVGTTFQTQSHLFLQSPTGEFTDATANHLPQLDASFGDAEFGDVDQDGDLDLVLADWGESSPMENAGGRTMLWLNDGNGQFIDVTADQMPEVLVRFSWEMELLDVDNDYDLDIAVSCKRCDGSFLFENDGSGIYTDVTDNRMPQYTNNYEFEAMDLNGDLYLDLVTMNDGESLREHVFINTGSGGFADATEELWPESANRGRDDNMVAFLDFDSDSDADFLIGSLNGEDRLMVNDGAGHLTMMVGIIEASRSNGTLGIAVADLNGDGRLDLAEAQGEVPGAEDERVYLGHEIAPDTALPSISLVEEISEASIGVSSTIRARIHDWKSPTMPHDWQSVELRWTEGEEAISVPMTWYGEYLWRGEFTPSSSGSGEYVVCATDVSGNQTCSAAHSVNVSG